MVYRLLRQKKGWSRGSESFVAQQSPTVKMECVFCCGEGAFWKQVISGKYIEEEGGWDSCKVREGYRIGLRKTIRKD